MKIRWEISKTLTCQPQAQKTWVRGWAEVCSPRVPSILSADHKISCTNGWSAFFPTPGCSWWLTSTLWAKAPGYSSIGRQNRKRSFSRSLLLDLFTFTYFTHELREGKNKYMCATASYCQNAQYEIRTLLKMFFYNCRQIYRYAMNSDNSISFD
jgi:hypothetical protein